MHALHQYAIHQRCRDDALTGMIKTACLKCKISPWWLRWGGRTNTNNDLGQKQRKGSKRTERSAFIGNEYVNVIMTLKLGFHLYPCYWEENENPSPVWSDIITARWKGKQLFILLVDTGIRYLEKVLWCQISPGNVVVVGGGLGGFGRRNAFSVLPAAFPALYYARLRGVNGTGRPLRLRGLLPIHSHKTAVEGK